MSTEITPCEIVRDAISLYSTQKGLPFEDITSQIIGSAFEVYRVLGYGFLEKVYHRAIECELQKRGLQTEIEHPIEVHYKGVIVGEYFADLLVESRVIVEIKVAEKYHTEHEAQLLNELKATGIKVGLLINFGKWRAEFKRLVF